MARCLQPQMAMEFPITLLKLAGSVALLLWGVHMVSTGVQRAFGAKLRSFLSNARRNRFKAFLAGLGITAALQSSTATGLMVTGFAAGGLVDLVPALAVMLGANVGTTLIVQVLSFDRLRLPVCVASSNALEEIRLKLESTGLLRRFDENLFSATM